MAVQKSKKTRSKRGMRRSHDALPGPTLATDVMTGELHLRHHVTKEGFYRGKQVLTPKVKADEHQDHDHDHEDHDHDDHK